MARKQRSRNAKPLRAVRGGSQSRKTNQVSLYRNPSPSFGGQQLFTVKMDGIPVKVTTTITTGVAAVAYEADAVSTVLGYGTRFSATFQEKRLIKARFKVTFLTPSTGVLVSMFDEKVVSVPTANQSKEQDVLSRDPITNVLKPKFFTWKARDVLDLEFSPVATASTPVTFKSYTSTADWGSTIVSTDIAIIEPTFWVQFRGLKST
jgi:hypothetical protein